MNEHTRAHTQRTHHVYTQAGIELTKEKQIHGVQVPVS